MYNFRIKKILIFFSILFVNKAYSSIGPVGFGGILIGMSETDVLKVIDKKMDIFTNHRSGAWPSGKVISLEYHPADYENFLKKERSFASQFMLKFGVRGYLFFDRSDRLIQIKFNTSYSSNYFYNGVSKKYGPGDYKSLIYKEFICESKTSYRAKSYILKNQWINTRDQTVFSEMTRYLPAKCDGKLRGIYGQNIDEDLKAPETDYRIIMSKRKSQENPF